MSEGGGMAAFWSRRPGWAALAGPDPAATSDGIGGFTGSPPRHDRPGLFAGFMGFARRMRGRDCSVTRLEGP
jgi:hypothetical protein